MVHCQIIRWVVGNLTWWRHQMEIFSALLAICAGNSPVTGEFPTQRPVTRSFDVYFDLRPNERLSKQWWGWWFETLSRSLWRHRNETSLLRRHCNSKSKRQCVEALVDGLLMVCWWSKLHLEPQEYRIKIQVVSHYHCYYLFFGSVLTKKLLNQSLKTFK